LMTNKVNSQHLVFLRRYVKSIYLCMDLDKAGMTQQKFVFENLKKAGFRVKKIPYLTGNDKVKDANDFLKVYGRDRLVREFTLRFKGV
jgi:DNA primase